MYQISNKTVSNGILSPIGVNKCTSSHRINKTHPNEEVFSIANTDDIVVFAIAYYLRISLRFSLMSDK